MLKEILRPLKRWATDCITWCYGWDNSVLVVVDMQPGYCRECAPTILISVAEEIKCAMARHQPIVIIECKPQKEGATFRSLQQLVRGYDRVVFVRKRGMDGSRRVLEICQAKRFPSNHFRVCGVYTHYCVEETANGLVTRQRRAQVDIIKMACTDPGGNRWNELELAPNVNLV